MSSPASIRARSRSAASKAMASSPSRTTRSRMASGFARPATGPALQRALQPEPRSGWREPATAVRTHFLDHRDQRLPLIGERVLDAGRHLGVGVPLDDLAFLERPQPQRERARADPLQRALKLAEAAI